MDCQTNSGMGRPTGPAARAPRACKRPKNLHWMIDAKCIEMNDV